ncbi:MAG TPA: type 4a pilus biogenesis protein PilO [Bryobacteraceae bacterium]|nr:type 4a pilus biogenesis protein PilO [Bryobacteraceae bacterium]
MIQNLKSSDPKLLVRAVLGVLAGANLIAAGLVLFPPGGSAEQLDQELAALRAQVAAQKARLEQTREHAAAVDKGRAEGDQFLSRYFLPLRTSYSTLLEELQKAAGETKIKPKDTSFSQEPIEGSDDLKMISITAGYEGKYEDLMQLVHKIDQSKNLLILESLSAAPQANTDALTVSLKLDTFVRDDGSGGEP